MPVGVAPHREIELDPGAEVRLEMAELAVAGDDRFEVSRMEVDKDAPAYTSETLATLREESPDDELFVILGGDQAAALGSWHEPEKVLELATVAVFERSELGPQRDRDQDRPAGGGAERALPRHAPDPGVLVGDPPAGA